MQNESDNLLFGFHGDFAGRPAGAARAGTRCSPGCFWVDSAALRHGATGIRLLLHVDLLAGALSNVPDKHRASLTVEAAPEWITQSECPDFSSRSGNGDKRIVWWNRVGSGSGINVNTKHFAEQSRQTLRIAPWFDVARSLVVRTAAISGRDVQIVRVAGAWTEADPSAVVIGLRVSEREQNSFTGWIRDVRIGRDGELRDVRHAIAKSAAGNGEVEIELSVCGIVWIKRHAEQTLLAAGSQASERQEWIRVERAIGEIENSDSAVLLHNE